MDKYKPKQKMKHNYTSEIELKSLLIRIKHQRKTGKVEELPGRNTRINKYIAWFNSINLKKYDNPRNKFRVKAKLKKKIIQLSEITSIDTESYERFGEIILLMVRNILTKPQFSGYTYRDDFYSDAIYKILKYLGNFDHTLISERSGQPVNSFAYISQIIHNSILYILNNKKKESDNLKKRVIMEHLNHELQLRSEYIWKQESIDEDEEVGKIAAVAIPTKSIELKNVPVNLVECLKELSGVIEKNQRVEIFYPNDYIITFDEYNELKHLLKAKVNLMRAKK